MKLGERMDVVALTVSGNTSNWAVVKLVDAIIKVLGMHRVHRPVIYNYPANNKGGVGFTYITPITESFIAFDAWPDFGGGYLMISSCRTVNLSKVKKKIRKFGYKIHEYRASELSLKKWIEDVKVFE